jgi:hypothetical protein
LEQWNVGILENGLYPGAAMHVFEHYLLKPKVKIEKLLLKIVTR